MASNISWQGKSRNATVYGSAQDNVGVVKMEVVVNGEVVYVTENSSLAISVRLNGRSDIRVMAYDAAGNKGEGPLHTIER